MPRRRSANGLKFDVPVPQITPVGGAQGSRPAGAGRLRESAAAQVGFIVRRRHLEIRVTARPVVRKKRARLLWTLWFLARLDRRGLRPRVKGEKSQKRGGKQNESLQDGSSQFLRKLFKHSGIQ